MRNSRSTSDPARRGSRRRGRRGPLATAALIGFGLLLTGGSYTLATAASAGEVAAVAGDAAQGELLFNENCATCHGFGATGTNAAPSLIGVGAAAVDFQVGTGRMPMQADSVQAPVKPVQFTDQQIADLAVYVAGLAPGPAIPGEEYTNLEGADIANGAQLFRTNCAMCHNVAAAGGALTEGKFAPPLVGVSATHIAEAMLTGPQNMPVFNDNNLSPEDKRDIIASLTYMEQNPQPGGLGLGGIGPVSEGLFIWLVGLAAVVGVTVWMTARPN